MIIKRGSNWYRPYYIELSTGVYKVDDIVFYNNDGIICNTDCGWLSKGIEGYCGDDIESIELPVDSIKLRRKIKFDGEVFAMTHRKEYERETTATLYIPADMLNIKFEKYYISLNILFAQYTGDNGIKISNVFKRLGEKLSELMEQFENESKNVESYRLISCSSDVISCLDKMADIARAYKAEQERINGLTIEEALVD